MADLFKVYQRCPQCKGEQEISEGTVDSNDESQFEMIVCPMCEGVGEIEWGRIEEQEPPTG